MKKFNYVTKSCPGSQAGTQLVNGKAAKNSETFNSNLIEPQLIFLKIWTYLHTSEYYKEAFQDTKTIETTINENNNKTQNGTFPPWDLSSCKAQWNPAEYEGGLA